MNRFRFEFMDKARKDLWLPRLFDMLYDNMKDIVPSGMNYEEEKCQWLSAVGPAMDKAPRQIILMFAEEKLAGYFQYYVNGGRFMVEEIQIVAEYQNTTLLYALFRYLSKVLPMEIETIGAYVHEMNFHSHVLHTKTRHDTGGGSGYQGFLLLRRRLPPNCIQIPKIRKSDGFMTVRLLIREV